MGLSRASKYLARGQKIVTGIKKKYRRLYERGEDTPYVRKMKKMMDGGYRP